MKRTLIAVLVTLTSLLFLGCSAYFGRLWYHGHLIRHYHHLLGTPDHPRAEAIDITKIRRALHRLLAWPCYGDHDSFLEASSAGDYTTVPHLIQALKHQPRTKPDDEGMECTKAHCIDALRDITGVHAGDNYEDWIKWWNDDGKHRVPESVAPTMNRLRAIRWADADYQRQIADRSPHSPLPVEGIIDVLSSTLRPDGRPFLQPGVGKTIQDMKQDQWGTPIQLSRRKDGRLVAESAGRDLKFGTADDLPPRRKWMPN